MGTDKLIAAPVFPGWQDGFLPGRFLAVRSGLPEVIVFLSYFPCMRVGNSCLHSGN